MKTSIRINPKYESLRPCIERIPAVMESEGTVVQDGRNLIKCLQATDGTLMNVKRYHRPSGINRYVYSLGIRKPKGQRAFEYPDILRENGIDTPEPIAYIEERKGGVLGYSYFVSVQSNYEHKCYELGDAPEGSYEDIAMALAAFTAKIHEAGMMHKDYSPGNILWTKNERQEYRFMLVDINQMYFGKVSARKGCKNFARLWGPKRFIIMMVREYARLRGFDANECENMALYYRAIFWNRYVRRKPEKVKFKLEL